MDELLGRWAGQSAFIVASGPSLTAEDCELLRGQNVIAVNCAVRLAPFAKILYAADRAWWESYQDDWRDFAGIKVTAESPTFPELLQAPITRKAILGHDRIATGISGNSGHQAANLAYLMGCSEIYLLGIDCKGSHFHGSHAGKLRNPSPANFRDWIEGFRLLHEALQDRGVSLWNCSRDSALTIPKMELSDAINRHPRIWRQTA